MELKKEVMDYLETKENIGALLVVGKWGSGKTYQISKIQEELNNANQYAVGRISLFGINTVEMLHRTVKEEYLKYAHKWLKRINDFSRKIQPFWNLARGGAGIATAASGVFSPIAGTIESGIGVTASIDFTEFYEVNRDIKKWNKEKEKKNKKKIVGEKIEDDKETGKRTFVLVFDDFERCRIEPKEDLMGAINDYCEKRGIKTIILADEERIDEAKDKEEDKESIYKRMKEKVIARTVKVDFDAKLIIENIIDSYKETVSNYRQYLKENKETIIAIFESNGNRNIRSLKKALFDFEKIYSLLNGKTYLNDDKFKKIFNGFIILKLENDLNNVEIDLFGYSIRFLDKNTGQKYAGIERNIHIQSIILWVMQSEFYEKEIVREIDVNCTPKVLQPRTVFLNDFILTIDDEDAQKGFNEVLKEGYNGELTIDEYRRFVSQIVVYNEYDIDFIKNIDYKKLEAGVDQAIEKLKKVEMDDDRIHPLGNQIKEKVPQEMHSICDKLILAYESYRFWQQRIQLLKAIPDGIKIRDNVFIIKQFDTKLVNIFFDRYSSLSNNMDKYDLLEMLIGIKYLFESHKDDSEAIKDKKETIENLALFITKIEEYNTRINKMLTKKLGEFFIKRIQVRIEELRNIQVK